MRSVKWPSTAGCSICLWIKQYHLMFLFFTIFFHFFFFFPSSLTLISQLFSGYHFCPLSSGSPTPFPYHICSLVILHVLLHRPAMDIRNHLPLFQVRIFEEKGANKRAWDPPLLSGQSMSYSGGKEMGRQSDQEGGSSEIPPWGIPGDWEAELSASLCFCVLLEAFALAHCHRQWAEEPLVGQQGQSWGCLPASKETGLSRSLRHWRAARLLVNHDISSSEAERGSQVKLWPPEGLHKHFQPHPGKVSHGWLGLAALFRLERCFCLATKKW